MQCTLKGAIMQRTILRFKDLKRLGIVTDRMTLRRKS